MWGFVVVQHPSACNAWSHTCHPFPESFKDFPIKSMIENLSCLHKFLVHHSLTVKKKWPLIWFWIWSFSLSLTWRDCNMPLPNLAFCLGVILQNPWFITCDNANEEFWLPLKAFQKIKTHIPPTGLLLSREVLWNHLGAKLSHVQILC